jgi:hypothetical protein
MNKTLLLIICDFLLLNLIHFTSWDTLDNETENPATGGSTTATVGAGGMGDISQDLELVTRQYRDIEDKLRKTQSTNFAMMAQMSDNEEQAATRLAAVADLAKEWKGAFDKSAATNEQNALVIQGLSQDKKVALAERERERKLNKEKQETIDNLQDNKNKLDVELANANKNITGLSNTVKNLNGTIGDLKTAIGGLEVKFDKASGDAEAARKMAAEERERAITALKAQATAERAQTAAETKALAETQRANIATQKAAAERALADTSARVAAAAKVEQARAEKEAQAAKAQAAQTMVQANNAVKAARVETQAARAQTEVARNAATTARAQTAKTEQNLAVAVRENTDLKATVENERTDKVIAQKAAEELREEILKEVKDKPINANTMATLYLMNQVNLNLQAKRSLLGSSDNAPTVLFETVENVAGKKTSYVYALAHASETPFKLNEKSLGMRSATGSVSAGKGAPQTLPQVRFLADDPRMVLFPIGPADSPKVKAVGVKPYKLASKPFKYPKAFIMSKNGRKFGEMDFKIDPANPGYVKVDRIFFNFGGRFNPAKGDLVFSQTGDLIGIMTSNKFCRVIQNTTPAYGITFGPELNARAIALGLSRMKSIVNAKPFALQ